MKPAILLRFASVLTLIFCAGHTYGALGASLRDPEQAALAAGKIGGPVAIKIVSPDILHKTEAGGVRLNLETPEAVAEAYTSMLADVARYAPDATIDGVLVQRMA